MSLISEKESIARLVKMCALKGLKYVVISPGSRNAPLTLSFAEDQNFECLNIPDERSAAFFALGMAQQLRQPVVLCCTSGSAALNYAPAIAEAYYQNIPLLILTADRPLEWIDQRAGQTIRQRDLYRNYIKKSFELIEEATQKEHLWYNDRIVNEAINECSNGKPGPIHLNVPLREPLYNLVPADSIAVPKIIEYSQSEPELSERSKGVLISDWRKYKSVLVIVGQGEPSEILNKSIERIAVLEKVVVLTETTSNVKASNVLPSIDRLIDSIKEDEYQDFAPELIISVGAAIVSKKIRFMLRSMNIKAHWQVDPYEGYVDTYKALTRLIVTTPSSLFNLLSHEHSSHEPSEFKNNWTQREKVTLKAHLEFLNTCPWSDLYVMSSLLSYIPSGILHLASSTPVRYTQLFRSRGDLEYKCNRGVSGIDGCTSTAAGYAYLSEKTVTLITGDIAFFYDSNGLWHPHLKPNLKIIMINNGGGNIFRYVKGPDTTNHLEQHFEAKHITSAEGIASSYDVRYIFADDDDSLKTGLKMLYQKDSKKACILEINTPGKLNIDILKAYFLFLSKQSESS